MILVVFTEMDVQHTGQVGMKSSDHQYKLDNVQKPWWSRPLFGQHTLREKLLTFFKKKESISDGDVFLHDRSLRKLEQITPAINRLDDEKFSKPEFILLLNISASFFQEKGKYKNLRKSSNMLKSAIEAKDIFLKIEQVEFQYYSFAQQDFYQAVFKLLEEYMAIKEEETAVKEYQNELKEKVQTLAQKTIQCLTTEEGISAINSYEKQLQLLASEHEVGLYLLYQFKVYELEDFSILQRISDLVPQLKKKDLYDFKRILLEVKLHYNIFSKLRKIIQIPSEQDHPNTYAEMMRYIALVQKHKHSYLQFEQLLAQLQVWQESYETLKILRDQYPAQAYRLPKTFREKIPGFSTYQKYQPWLVLKN